MVRGISFYVLVWFVVTIALYVLSRLSKREKMTLYRCVLYGLGTASAALAIVLLIVYLF
jgi:hypothetical protein